MSRFYVQSESDNLQVASAPVTGAAFTASAWANSNDAGSAQTVVSLTDVSKNDNYFYLFFAGDVGGDPIIFAQEDTASGGNTATTSTGYSVNTWHHVCAVEAATNDHRVFIDGGSNVTDTSTRTPTGIDTIGVGLRATASPSRYFDGHIDEVAVWNVALPDIEVAALAAGAPAFQIRPANLKFYL